MECENCGKPANKGPLHRTKPTGQPDAGWMCYECIKLKEPELYDNLSKDGSLRLINDIFDCLNQISKTWYLKATSTTKNG